MTCAHRITAEYLRSRFHYCPETGVFTRLVNAGKKASCRAGTVAGFITQPTGYVALSIDNRHYLAHRLAWLYMTGAWPTEQVDHRDRDRTNNRWANLRAATHKQNCENASVRVDNLCGVRGVYFWEARGKWASRINHNKKSVFLGYHDTLVDAVAARRAAEAQLFTHAPCTGQ